MTTRELAIALEPSKGELPERMIYCDPLHVTRIEPLNAAKSTRRNRKRKT